MPQIMHLIRDMWRDAHLNWKFKAQQYQPLLTPVCLFFPYFLLKKKKDKGEANIFIRYILY